MLLIFSWFIVYIFVSYNLFGVKKKKEKEKKKLDMNQRIFWGKLIILTRFLEINQV